MLETLDLSLKLARPAYREKISGLRARLRDIQLSVRDARLPVVVLFEGFDAAGKGDSIGHLVYPLDPRGFKVYTTRAPNEEEGFRPFLWRFSIRLPGRGDFVFFDRSWYRRLLEDRLDGEVRKRDVAETAAEIREFERSLAADGYLLVKFWLHITKKEQERRFRAIENDRYEKWRTTQKEWRRKPYRKYLRAAEEMLELTGTAEAPWVPVEAMDPHFRRVKVIEGLLGALERKVPGERKTVRRAARVKPQVRRELSSISDGSKLPSGQPTVLDKVDLTKRLPRADYEKKLDRLQERLREQGLEAYRRRRAAVIVYEGWDAAGKGGNIKRLTQELDPRGYEVIPIGAPDATEKNHHYLWRFWRQLPKAGHMAIFDRSWYGRVLVERVEGFASETEWKRAYEEINQFERHIADSGAVIVKFWLHLSPEEQLKRFEERERTPYKNHKITPEDWRNRARWGVYRLAVADMIEKTSTRLAPWTIVEAEDKLWARIRTLTEVVGRMEKAFRS